MDIFDIVINLIESTLYISFVFIILKKNKDYLPYIAAIFIYFLSLNLFNFFHIIPDFILNITTLFIIFLYASYLNSKQPLQNLFISLLIDCINNITVTTSVILTSFIYEFPFYVGSSYVFMVITSKILFLLLGFIVSKYITTYHLLNSKKIKYILLVLFVILLMYSQLIDFIFFKSVLNSYIMIILMLLNILSVFVCVIFFESQKEQIERLSLQKDMLRLETQEKIYKLNQENILEIRKWRHDIKHLFLSIKHHLTHNEIEEAISLLEQENQIANKSNVYVHSGNDLLDSILIDKRNIIKDNNIHLIVNCGSNDCPLNQTQFFIIVGNLLDNAIECCINTKQKQIDISIGIQKDYYFIKIQNSISQSILASNPRLITTKKDNLGHGFGIRNIKRIMNECNGDIHFDELNNQFIVKVLIPIN